LLPTIPTTVVPLLADVFEIFNRLVICAHNKSGICRSFHLQNNNNNNDNNNNSSNNTCRVQWSQNSHTLQTQSVSDF